MCTEEGYVQRFRLFTLTQGENRDVVGILNVRKVRVVIIIIIIIIIITIIIHISYLTAVSLVPRRVRSH